MESTAPVIPVICDRCREEGLAGDDPFTAIRDLLDFEPVQRRAHVNGWTPEHQRAFIAALALTGSPRQAARALGRWANGADQLRKGKSGRSFAEAWEAALELYREREFFRIKDNLAALAEQQQARDEASLSQTHLRALPPPTPTPLEEGQWDEAEYEEEPPAIEELTRALFAKFIAKVRAERKARLAGRIAEADFYLRQISYFEVAIELAGEDVLIELQHLRKDGVHVTDIAETRGTRLLDRLRRKTWIELELERAASSRAEGDAKHDGACLEQDAEPQGRDLLDDCFPPHLLADRGDFSIEPLPCHGPHAHPAEGHTAESWTALDAPARKQSYEDQYARAAAEEQVKWEAEMLLVARTMKVTGKPYADD